jgi:hypothetical protein
MALVQLLQPDSLIWLLDLPPVGVKVIVTFTFALPSCSTSVSSCPWS